LYKTNRIFSLFDAPYSRRNDNKTTFLKVNAEIKSSHLNLA
jgi:hypothetical protein